MSPRGWTRTAWRLNQWDGLAGLLQYDSACKLLHTCNNYKPNHKQLLSVFCLSMNKLKYIFPKQDYYELFAWTSTLKVFFIKWDSTKFLYCTLYSYSVLHDRIKCCIYWCIMIALSMYSFTVAVFLSIHQDTNICAQFYLWHGSVVWHLQAALLPSKLHRGTDAATNELWLCKQTRILSDFITLS